MSYDTIRQKKNTKFLYKITMTKMNSRKYNNVKVQELDGLQ